MAPPVEREGKSYVMVSQLKWHSHNRTESGSGIETDINSRAYITIDSL